MVVFRVTENLNIKTTDGSLIKYIKLKNPANFLNEGLYITTLEDFESLKEVFTNVGRKYKAKVIDETRVRDLGQFPLELGISNLNEYTITNTLEYKLKKETLIETNEELQSLFLDENSVDLLKQVDRVSKQDISLVILGSLGLSVSEMICACSALRILYTTLKKQFKNVKIDIYINASENKYFTRDKAIFSNQTFINKVSGLSIDVKSLCEYDFFIDASSVTRRSYYEVFPHIDAWLYKFGIDYKKIPDEEKYNTINFSMYRPKDSLKEKLDRLKQNGKIILFHPFSANINKSIPKEKAVSLLKELIDEMPEYNFVSVIKIDIKSELDRFTDLSGFSQTFLDYSYIVSNASKVITVNTATYHIAEAFFIPTVVIFTDNQKRETPHIYSNSKAIYIKDMSRKFSKLVFKNDLLTLYKFEGWNRLKASEIIKLLEKF
ncbi:glycosyltransferase family 9 protein [Halarcobacter ebronensis]|uniref:Uncharacterized protein n=1 Tax=Halarcobacter ebronensis TaxID=1462615 RepID=A0A4Q1AS76_9BACT|nr:hypothetical protein [Halarcobacter ebronensis]QKF82929.1 hypothetical protein AEBR_2462 [Halarcobacter ebronensis]RXK06944.1 hypothetical protein CRV07_05820 [Halarcobacter ebronensis]